MGHWKPGINLVINMIKSDLLRLIGGGQTEKNCYDLSVVNSKYYYCMC